MNKASLLLLVALASSLALSQVHAKAEKPEFCKERDCPRFELVSIHAWAEGMCRVPGG
jgi:hypothetical protein